MSVHHFGRARRTSSRVASDPLRENWGNLDRRIKRAQSTYANWKNFAGNHFLLSPHLGRGIMYIIDPLSSKVVRAITGLPGITRLEYAGNRQVYTLDWGKEKIAI